MNHDRQEFEQSYSEEMARMNRAPAPKVAWWKDGVRYTIPVLIVGIPREAYHPVASVVEIAAHASRHEMTVAVICEEGTQYHVEEAIRDHMGGEDNLERETTARETAVRLATMEEKDGPVLTLMGKNLIRCYGEQIPSSIAQEIVNELQHFRNTRGGVQQQI